MSKYAVGRRAYGISDRSGFKYPLNRMRKEWTGLLVGADEWEAKHPQLEPVRDPIDGQALKDARPETELSSQRSTQYGFNPVGFKEIEGLTADNNLVATGEVGTVTVFLPKILGVQASGSVGNVGLGTSFTLTGASGTGSVGTVTVVV